MKVIAVTTFWKRPDVSKIFWTQCNEIGLKVIAIVSEGDNENIRLARKHALEVVYHPNGNLPKKWQAGMNVLKNHKFDYFLLMGSDDLVSKKFFTKICEKQYKDKSLYFGLRDAVAYSVALKKFRYWPGYLSGSRVGESIGPGRMIHKSLLQKIGYRLFEDNMGSVDHRCTVKLLGIKVKNKLIATGKEPYRIGIKTEGTLAANLKGSPFNLNISLGGYYSNKVIDMIIK